MKLIDVRSEPENVVGMVRLYPGQKQVKEMIEEIQKEINPNPTTPQEAIDNKKINEKIKKTLIKYDAINEHN